MPGREEGAAGSRQLHLHSVGPTHAPRCPGPNQDLIGACASRGSTYFVTSALGFVIATGGLSLVGWRRHRPPGAGAASPVSQLQHLALPLRRGCLQHPET